MLNHNFNNGFQLDGCEPCYDLKILHLKMNFHTIDPVTAIFNPELNFVTQSKS